MGVDNSYVFKFRISDLNKVEAILDFFEEECYHSIPVKIKIGDKLKDYHFLSPQDNKYYETVYPKEIREMDFKETKGTLRFKFIKTKEFEQEISEIDPCSFDFKIKIGDKYFNIELMSYINVLSNSLETKTLLDVFFKFCKKLNPYVAFIGYEEGPGKILWFKQKKIEVAGQHFMELNTPDDIKFISEYLE